MKDFIFDQSLWAYGLVVSMLGGSFIFMDRKKQDKGTCAAIHKAADQRLESMDKKLDKLIDMHLKSNNK